MERWKRRILTEEQNCNCRLINDRRAYNTVVGLASGGRWTVVGRSLAREWKFKNFAAALKFVNAVGALAEKENHHPDITFGYGYVKISLFSHDEGKITEKDRRLASLIDGI